MKMRAFSLIAVCLMILSVSLSGCGASTRTAPVTPTEVSSPASTSTAKPSATPNTYQTWSTNFSNVLDLNNAGIIPSRAQAIVDTAHVNSGGKSIRTYGRIGNRGSYINLAFYFSGMIGQDSLDLSEKKLSIEMFLPEDSPIDAITINVLSGGDFVMIRSVHTNLQKGQWHTYTADIRQDIALTAWRPYANMTSLGLTDDQAVNVLKHAEWISVTGMVMSDTAVNETYFLVDKLGWEPAGSVPAYDAAQDSLQKYSPARLSLGGFIQPEGVNDPEYMRNLVQEFNASVAWSQLPASETPGGAFSFDESWNLTPYADTLNERDGFKLIRYAAEQPNDEIPDWLPKKSYTEAQTILENYIRALVEHYQGKTYIWNLFSDLLSNNIGGGSKVSGLGLKNRDRSPATWANDYSPWSDTPSDLALIEDAFRVARAADPQALLFLSEANAMEQGQAKAEAFYNLVKQIKTDGIPIDGIGLATHITLRRDGYFYAGAVRLAFDPIGGFTGIATNVERFAALGLKLAFTEVDISIDTGDIEASPEGQARLATRQGLQADAYRSLLLIALTHPNVVAFNLWDWTDRYSWAQAAWDPTAPVNSGNDLGLFDWAYQKKPAYYTMLGELKGSTTQGAFNKYKPAQGANDQPDSLTLSWGPSWNASGYEYCIDNSDNNTCDSTWKSAGKDLSVPLSNLTPGVSYFWQVRAINPNGAVYANGGTWWSFSPSLGPTPTPTPLPRPEAFNKLKPDLWATDILTYPTLSWEPLLNATGYEYCIDTSNDNICDTTWISTGKNLYATLSGLTPGATYFWQVRGSNGAGVILANQDTWWAFTVTYGPNLALHKPVKASSYAFSASEYLPENAVDGDATSRWGSALSEPEWIYVDLGAVFTINKVVLNWPDNYATAYQVQVSNNATDWTTIYSTNHGTVGINVLIVSGSGRYIRMLGIHRVALDGIYYNFNLSEFEVYGYQP